MANQRVLNERRKVLRSRIGYIDDDFAPMTLDAGDVRILLDALEEAEANYRFMVERAADQKLDAYRELAAKCAELETQRDAAIRERDEAHAHAAECREVRHRLAKERDEARADMDSMCRELATMCGGPGKPRDGETRVAYWLRRVGTQLSFESEMCDLFAAGAEKLKVERDAAEARARGAEAARHMAPDCCAAVIAAAAREQSPGKTDEMIVAEAVAGNAVMVAEAVMADTRAKESAAAHERAVALTAELQRERDAAQARVRRMSKALRHAATWIEARHADADIIAEIDAALADGADRHDPAAAERTRIVAWLRSTPACLRVGDDVYGPFQDAADALADALEKETP